MKRQWLLIWGLLTVLLVACTPKAVVKDDASVADQTLAAVPAEADVPLIERDMFFGNPDIVGVRLSPDGRWISYVAPHEGVLNVWVAPAGNMAAARVVTNDKGRGITSYHWAFSNRHIVYLQDQGGDENWQIFGVDLQTRQSTLFTPADKVQANIVKVSHKFPEEILIGLNDRNPQYHDIYRLNIVSGEKTLVIKNDGFGSFVFDDDYKLRFADRPTPEGGFELLEYKEDGTWASYMDVSMEDAFSTSLIDLTPDGQGAYMISSIGRNTAALVELTLADKSMRVLAEDPKADVTSVMIHPVTKKVEGVRVEFERNEWTFMDEAVKADFETLKAVRSGDLWITSRTLDDRRWIAVFDQDNGPVLFYLYDRDRRKADFLFAHRPKLQTLPLTHMYPTVIKSRDGLDLVAYYSLPAWEDHNGTPAKPLPLVLVVHGGPWYRDSWGYDPFHQWMSNRGFAVLSVNFRGSTGFGKDFVNAANREWGGKMHDDLIDAVDWAEAQKIADPERVAIFGGSYGGYATLVGMTFTPERFACGVDLVGPSNLVTFLNAIPPYWTPYLEMFTKRVGDHRTDDGRQFLMSRSPITFVDKIARPLLIGQGANDPRVVKNESDQLAKAMQERNIPVTYVLYPDEGHGFKRPENRQSFFAITEVFLADCLGGRSEPIGASFPGSSIQVPVGASSIPGLLEALEPPAAVKTESENPVQP